MADVTVFEPGGYRFINAVFQYSGGVAAQPGFEIVRARLNQPLPADTGLDFIESHLRSLGRPTTAFCACELRSPSPFSETGFIDFNRHYVSVLERWGIFSNEINPVARTNVCPEFSPPSEPSLFAFSYTLPTQSSMPSFIVSGGGEGTELNGSFEAQIVRLNDCSSDGMREKMRYVLTEMEQRLQALGFGWADATAVQAYTVYDIGAHVGPEVAQRGAATSGLSWSFARPPVIGLDYEMDVRGPAREIVLDTRDFG